MDIQVNRKNKTANEEIAEIREANERITRPKSLLLQAYVEGRYAAQVGYRTYHRYRGEMADAWEKGWRSIHNDENTGVTEE